MMQYLGETSCFASLKAHIQVIEILRAICSYQSHMLISYQSNMDINMTQPLWMVTAILTAAVTHTAESSWAGNSVSGEHRAVQHVPLTWASQWCCCLFFFPPLGMLFLFLSPQIKGNWKPSYILVNSVEGMFKQNIFYNVWDQRSHCTFPLDCIYLPLACPGSFQNIYHRRFHNNLRQQVFEVSYLLGGKTILLFA